MRPISPSLRDLCTILDHHFHFSLQVRRRLQNKLVSRRKLAKWWSELHPQARHNLRDS
ncbi:unnamed protein product [Haemonchus placei]|uniref:Transposase n=1 Tax=Haemonchus placei TaxID=6290 RepID=A0A158QPC1_HAEPC|nr:unnamed protein product [Haemonchus placei]